jgi:AcrR family transcriptional regulator
MPKLQDHDVERNQVMIEKAALHVFTRQGFHGTSVRDIAREAGLSLGNLYNYYATKEDIYVSLVKRYGRQMLDIQEKTLKHLLGRLDEDGLRQLAYAVRDIVYNHSDYWRLMYIDVVEFGNRHFINSFRQVSMNLQRLAGGFPKRAEGVRADVDLPAAYTAVYMNFFTYFLTEELFGGKQHMGLPEDQAITQLIEIFQYGVKSPGTNTGRANRASTGRRKK